jgi:cell wall-associated NlpC family hydrolase
VRLLFLLAALLVTTSLFAVEDDPPKKRGGFTAATPKPVAKKSVTAEATPRKKAKVRDDADDDAEPEKKPTPRRKKPAASDESDPVTTPEVTPAPKRKAKPIGESTSEERKPTPAAATPKPAAPRDAEVSVESPAKREHAPAATVAPEEIAEFAAQPPKVRDLITAALELTRLNLTYTYGSADPAQGGMDCSGTMYHLLRSQGFPDVPRDSSSQYVWARKAGPFFAVVSKSAESFEFRDLQPGDLLFWTGTYETGREIPISHVMLYLGTEKRTKKRIMFGSSDGRSYDGVQRWGVSVFDFKMPKADPENPERSKVDFVGYGRIPALREAAPANIEPVVAKKMPEETATPEPVEKKPVVSKKKRGASGARKGS